MDKSGENLDIAAMFTGEEGAYAFARWGRPVVPVVFGVDEATLSVVKGAVEAVVTLAGHQIGETDPELGANLMLFFFSEWDELLEVPRLGDMVPDLANLVDRVKSNRANQYRGFRFDDNGAIQMCFSFIQMDGELAQMDAEAVALGQAVGAILTWSQAAFARKSALAKLAGNGALVLRPEIADLIRVAYDPVMPVATHEVSHALRLTARLQST